MFMVSLSLNVVQLSLSLNIYRELSLSLNASGKSLTQCGYFESLTQPDRELSLSLNVYGCLSLNVDMQLSLSLNS
jgi:hypothetical protein